MAKGNITYAATIVHTITFLSLIVKSVDIFCLIRLYLCSKNGRIAFMYNCNLLENHSSLNTSHFMTNGLYSWMYNVNCY